MIKSGIATVLILVSAFLLTSQYKGYPRAGKEYFRKATEERKSLRAGSGYYGPYHGGSGGFRSGK